MDNIKNKIQLIFFEKKKHLKNEDQNEKKNI